MNTSNEFGFHSANYLPRPRLDEIFDQATRFAAVYVVAGTGYGKTQAVRHYVEQQQDALVRWMQLTESDNVASRYWESFIHTFSVDNPVLAAKLRELGFPETLARFKQFSEIIRSAEHRSRKVFLVLDDFHLIHSKETHNFVERLAHLEVYSTCMIIISQNEPAASIVCSLSKGTVSVIREDELRFTVEEATEFFRQHAISLPAQDISHLIDATKGWVLAINMFSLIFKRIPNNFKHALDMVLQNIFKLLEAEAWNDLSENMQKTMVKLSLLSNLPVLPLQELSDDATFWENALGLTSFMWFDSFTNNLKIHPLYLDFLQGKHHILSHEEQVETYRQAAQWCSEHDFHMDAMHYYAKSYQFDRMVQTLLSFPFKLPRDISEYFLDILKDLNADKGEQSDLNILFLKNYFVPLLLVGAGKYEEAQEQSFAVIREWEHVGTPLSRLFLYAIYSALTYIELYVCTVTHEYNGPLYLKKSVEYYQNAALPPARASGAFLNADIRSFACLVGEDADLAAIDRFFESVRQTEIYIKKTPHSVYAGYEDLLSCEYAFFKNQPELARNHAHHAILEAREKKQYSIVALAENYLLRIAMQEGDVPLVKKLLEQLRSHLDNPNFWNRQLYYDLYTGAFYAYLKLLDLIPSWLILNEKEAASEIRIPARELYVNALYYIASKKYQQALTVLSNSYPREPHERFLFGELRLSLLTAVARIQTGDTAGAMAEFERAYELSFHGVFELFFIELGKELHPLIISALKQTDCKIPDEWLKTIDRKASIYAKKIAVVANALRGKAHGGEPVVLSEREREVLIDLYHGLSRDEIAANRYLSINTVKKILQSLYIKLGAHNNVDAVRIGLEKKLIG